MGHKRPKQSERILQYMKDFGSITQLEALNDLGCMRLASRITELRKAGYEIEDEFVRGKNRYGEPVHFKKYWLKGRDDGRLDKTPQTVA